MQNSLQSRIDDYIKEIIPDTVRFRQRRHSYPELKWHENQTAAEISAELKKIPGLVVHENIGKQIGRAHV